jgi:hypothetical protein
MRRIILLLFIVCSNLLSHAQCADMGFKSGEDLSYNCYYNWGFIWVKAGFANINTVVDQGKYNIKAACSSSSAWDWFFKLRDTMSVSGDAKTFLPLKFQRIANEGSYHARFNYDFNYNDSCVLSSGFKRNDLFVNKKIKLDTPALDVITFSWFVRGINFDKYKKNDKIPVRMIISNKIYNLYIRYKGVEKVKLKTGEKIECYKFAPMLIKGNTFSGGETMLLWVSKDDNRVPVMMEAKVVVGSVKAVLSSYEHIRFKSDIFPTTSGTMGELR